MEEYKEDENLDSQNEETDQDVEDLDNTDDTDEVEDVDALKEKNKQLFARAKKAEEELKALRKPKEEAPKKEQPQPQQQPDIDTLLNEKLEQRDLDSMDLPDDIKAEVQKIAKMQGISVRKAASDPYIKYKLEAYEQEQKVTEAAITRTRKGTKVKFDPQSPPQVDMSTEEGRKTWDEYTEFLKGQNAG